MTCVFQPSLSAASSPRVGRKHNQLAPCLSLPPSTTTSTITKEQMELLRTMSVKSPRSPRRKVSQVDRLAYLKDRYSLRKSIKASKKSQMASPLPIESSNVGPPGSANVERKFVWNSPEVIIVNIDEVDEHSINFAEEDTLEQVNGENII